ncbi:MAG: HAD family hydrolase [Firmicutes bacterium]|nr:HAD family hydrolase [Bacillota bacterium]
MYDIYLFDLDGTLTNPKLGITMGLQFALKFFGIEVSDPSQLEKFIGPPLRQTFSEDFGLSKENAEVAVQKYREYYGVTGLYQNEVYKGIHELLAKLKEKGKILGVATSKPTVYAMQILEHFGLLEYFAVVSGSEFDGTRDSKSEVIEYVLSQLGVSGERVVMIGDRMYDIIGAKEIGIKSVGVTYGFGTYEELQKAGADKIVDRVEELLDL